MIFEADSFRGDWEGFINNQASHAYLVGIPAAWIVSRITSDPIAILGIIIFFYSIWWEVIAQHGGDWKDSAEDTIHVALASAFIISAWGYTSWGVWPYVAQAVLLLIGAIVRKVESE